MAAAYHMSGLKVKVAVPREAALAPAAHLVVFECARDFSSVEVLLAMATAADEAIHYYDLVGHRQQRGRLRRPSLKTD